MQKLSCTNDLTYSNNGEEELVKYKTEIRFSKGFGNQNFRAKIWVGHRQTKDPFDFFKDKEINQTVTVKVISTDNKGLVVSPENCSMNFQIKKSEISINAADARPSRWTGGEKLDVAIKDLHIEKRKVTLSIKLLEEIEKKESI